MTSLSHELVTASSGPLSRPAVSIRLFEKADAAAVAEIFTHSEEGWPGGLTHGMPLDGSDILQRQSDQQPSATFILWEGSDAAGYCSLFEGDEGGGRIGYIGLLNVASRFQGRGYGRMLLRAALNRCVDRDLLRLELGTWPGNLNGLPLYKKFGFMWLPDTSIHMINHLPQLLREPLLQDFWSSVDWYRSHVREFAVEEDVHTHGARRVYPYEFRAGEHFVKARYDAVSHTLIGLETDRFRIDCDARNQTLVTGMPRTVRIEIENRAHEPLPVALSASGAGVSGRAATSLLVRDQAVFEITVEAPDDLQPPEPGQSLPRLEILALVAGIPLRLAPGFKVSRIFHATFDPALLTLLVGTDQQLTCTLRNALDRAVTARVTAMVPSGAQVTTGADPGAPITLDLAAEAEGSFALQFSAAEHGLHQLHLLAETSVDGRAVTVSMDFALPVVATGRPAAFVETRYLDGFRRPLARAETTTHRLRVDPLGGRWFLDRLLDGRELLSGAVIAGPPFGWLQLETTVHTAQAGIEGGMPEIVLRGSSKSLDGASVEHRLSLEPDGVVRVQSVLIGGSKAAPKAQTALVTFVDRIARPTVVLPTSAGVVAGDDPDWPDWGTTAMQRPELYTEQWFAAQGPDSVAGLCWSEALRIDPDNQWRSLIVQGKESLLPGERVAFTPVYAYSGPGSWKTVRELWRARVRPGAAPSMPEVRPSIQLTAEGLPGALFTGQSLLRLSALLNRPADGTLRFLTAPGWTMEPASIAVEALSAREELRLAVSAHRDRPGPGAAKLQARLRTDRSDSLVFDGALIAAGSGSAVRSESRQSSGMQIHVVDNGFMRFQLAPEFAGSLTALETADGRQHLLSAFPEPRPFGWLRPWYGGIFAGLYGDNWEHWGDHAGRHLEQYVVRPATAVGLSGCTWQGLEIEPRKKDDGKPSVVLTTAYLTLPGSNMLAIRTTVRNDGLALKVVHPALCAFLQPGGAVQDAELLTDAALDERVMLRSRRTKALSARCWVASRNPRNGVTTALVGAPGGADARVLGDDWGVFGAHGSVQARFRLPAGGRHEFLAFLIVAQSVEEARAYQVLSEAARTLRLP